jgi:hypothetical protein
VFLRIEREMLQRVKKGKKRIRDMDSWMKFQERMKGQMLNLGRSCIPDTVFSVNFRNPRRLNSPLKERGGPLKIGGGELLIICPMRNSLLRGDAGLRIGG